MFNSIQDKGFDLTSYGYVSYFDINDGISKIYIGDYEPETVTLEMIEKDFLEMLEQCGADCDTRERKALFAFVYYSVVCLKKA